MHSFRLRYIVLGLLIYLQNAFCRPCGLDFDDIASKAVLADVVFEGSLNEKLFIHENGSEYKGRFNVKKLFKGNLPKVKKRGKTYHPVVTGIFGFDGGAECNTEVDTSKTYLMFLKLNTTAFNQTQFYDISDLPELSTKRTRRDIRNILCKDCAKSPRGKLSPKEVTIHEGKRLSLRCKATGKPKPIITWSKDGRRLKKSKKYRFKNSKSSSRLRINKVTIDDTGRYICHIKNAVGEITKTSEVTVISAAADNVSSTPETPSHAIPCQQQTLCLNGGTCYILQDLNEEYCKCAPNFKGRRCTEKDPDIITRPDIGPSAHRVS